MDYHSGDFGFYTDPFRRRSCLLTFSPKHTPREIKKRTSAIGVGATAEHPGGASGVGGIFRTRPSHSSPLLKLVITQTNRPHSTQIDTTKHDDTVINIGAKKLQITMFILHYWPNSSPPPPPPLSLFPGLAEFHPPKHG